MFVAYAAWSRKFDKAGQSQFFILHVSINYMITANIDILDYYIINEMWEIWINTLLIKLVNCKMYYWVLDYRIIKRLKMQYSYAHRDILLTHALKSWNCPFPASILKRFYVEICTEEVVFDFALSFRPEE